MAGIDANTLVMLHMNGADASTTFTDSAPAPHTFTANGDAQIDTAQSKFSGASGLFDGTGDFLSYTPSYTIGTGDFTVDFWVRFNSVASTQFFQTMTSGITNEFDVAWYTANEIRVFLANSAAYAFAWTPLTGTWYHVAVTRNGTNLRAFVDGTQIGSTLTSSNNIPSQAAKIGSERSTAYFNGWLDEYRISNVARWTANFTAPTAEYTSDVNLGSWFRGLPLQDVTRGLIIQ